MEAITVVAVIVVIIIISLILRNLKKNSYIIRGTGNKFSNFIKACCGVTKEKW
jgi:competence protein ComGC